VYKHRLRKDLEQQAERRATEARVVLEALLIPIVPVAKSLERTREDFARMTASEIFVLLLKALQHLAVLQTWERKAMGVELVDPRKDGERGARRRNAQRLGWSSRDHEPAFR
jgi:hypothetical protein